MKYTCIQPARFPTDTVTHGHLLKGRDNSKCISDAAFRLSNTVWNGRARGSQIATPYKWIGRRYAARGTQSIHPLSRPEKKLHHSYYNPVLVNNIQVTHKITVSGYLKNRYHKIYIMIFFFLNEKKTPMRCCFLEAGMKSVRDTVSCHTGSGMLLPLLVSVASDCSRCKHQHRSCSSHFHLCLPNTNIISFLLDSTSSPWGKGPYKS